MKNRTTKKTEKKTFANFRPVAFIKQKKKKKTPNKQINKQTEKHDFKCNANVQHRCNITIFYHRIIGLKNVKGRKAKSVLLFYPI